MSELVNLFLEFVQIDSETGQEDKFMQYLEELLKKEFNAKCCVDKFGNLLARIEGKGSKKSEPLLIACHGDTVKPGKGIKPVIKDGTIYSSGDTVLGADDKAGIAEVVWALKSVARHPSIEFIVTRQEENALKGARSFDVSQLKSKVGFLVDSDEIDKLVVGGPCKINFDVEFIGKAAHSGMEPEKGISAIRAAAIAISKMKLGRIDGETTANIGIIHGGINRNSVPDRCQLVGEARGMNTGKANKQADHMEECLNYGAKVVGAKININRDNVYQAVMLDLKDPVVEIARDAIKSVGLTPREEVVGGGTDASIYNAKGIPTIVLGTGEKMAHTVNEHIKIEDMEKAVSILHYIFERLS